MKIFFLFFLGIIIIIIYALIRRLISRRREINVRYPKKTYFLKRLGFRKLRKSKRFDGKIINLAKKTFDIYLDSDFFYDLREEDENMPLSDFVLYEQRKNCFLKEFFAGDDTVVSCQDIVMFCRQHRADLATSHNFFCYRDKVGNKKIAEITGSKTLCLDVIGIDNDCIFVAEQRNRIFLKEI